MGDQRIIAVIEDRQIIIKFDITAKLGELRKFLIDQKYILIDAEGDTWRFEKVKDGKVTNTAHPAEEKYIPVSEYIDDTDKIFIGNLKKSICVFADTIHEFFRFDVSHKLDDLRKLLTDKKFIKADEKTIAWRFVSPAGVDLEDVTEAIIGKQVEGQLPVEKFLYGSNKVRMVNINREDNFDLVGVGVDYLEDRDIEVRVIRNDSVTPDKLSPIIMKNVRPANKHGVKADFVNVVLCEKETAIGIRISTKTHGGFVVSITVQEGKDIASKSYVPYTGWTTYAYEDTRKAIEVVSYKNLDIPSQQSIGYRRVTVKVWRYISYEREDGKKYIVDDNAPKRKAYNRGIDVVSGDSIEGGGFVEGDDTGSHVGGGYIFKMEEDPNDILGIFEIDFLVFKTKEDAQNMVESRIDPIYD